LIFFLQMYVHNIIINIIMVCCYITLKNSLLILCSRGVTGVGGGASVAAALGGKGNGNM
jgi:L-cystine uptake protein TcyP (sodium:dicarboxylate symporter family)